MSARSIKFATTRPRFWIPTVIGTGLIIGGVSSVAGIILIVFGLLKLRGVLKHDDLEDRLRLRDEKRKHKVYRRLRHGERSEIIMLDRYCHHLRKSGLEPGLATEIMSHAWRTIREGRGKDVTGELRKYRYGLPSLSAGATVTEEQGIANKVQEEIYLMQASRREVEAIG